MIDSAAAWLKYIEPTAYGALRLKPRELEDMQPQEVTAMIRAYELAEERQATKTAYFTYWIIAPHLGKRSRVTPAMIAEPFIKKEVKSHDELLKEKEHYLSMMKEGE